MKKKFILPMIVISSLLSSCTLFNDDDIRVTNSYNPFIEEISTDPSAPKAQGVTGKTVENTPNALCFKNISYAKENTIENRIKKVERITVNTMSMVEKIIMETRVVITMTFMFLTL